MFNKNQFSSLISRVITLLGRYSLEAVNLLLGTAAQESDFGTNLHQIGGGPGKGVFQMEPATEEDIWVNYLRYNAALRHKVIDISGVTGPNPLALEGNLIYQICMARLHYYRVPEPLPGPDDILAMAKYYKKFFNTYKGKGTISQFEKKYQRYVLKERVSPKQKKE